MITQINNYMAVVGQIHKLLIQLLQHALLVSGGGNDASLPRGFLTAATARIVAGGGDLLSVRLFMQG